MILSVISGAFFFHAVWRIVHGRDAVAMMALIVSYTLILTGSKLLLPGLAWQPFYIPFMLSYAVSGICALIWLPSHLVFRSSADCTQGHLLNVYFSSVLAVHVGLLIWIYWLLSWFRIAVVYMTFPPLICGTVYTVYRIALCCWKEEDQYRIPWLLLILLGLFSATFIVFAALVIPNKELILKQL